MRLSDDTWLMWLQIILPLALGVAMILDGDMFAPAGPILIGVSLITAVAYWRRSRR